MRGRERGGGREKGKKRQRDRLTDRQKGGKVSTKQAGRVKGRHTDKLVGRD